jgi:hypothetical protein
MNRRFSCHVIAGLAIAAATPEIITAVSEPVPNVEIVVNGTPQRRYAHQGRWYIEALKGHEYAIQLRNPYGVRVAVALSVDGLNTIDARETSAADARKWVLDPYETITISGWQTSWSEARHFEFTTEERSYGQAIGKTANLGVITAVFFKERVPEVRTYRESSRRQAPSAPDGAGAPAASSAADAQSKRANEEYAATGMGRTTDHAVTQVWLNLESTPAHSVNIRYEFRPQLVKLGILPATPINDPLQRRERARGFEPGFAPVPPAFR